MRPHVRWIPLFACVCMLSGGAADVSSEQGKAKGAATKAVKDQKNDKARKNDKDKHVKANKSPVGEVRPGRNDDDPRLVRWDINHDGLLSRAEWKAPKELFDRLDINRDDMLTPAELAERP